MPRPSTNFSVVSRLQRSGSRYFFIRYTPPSSKKCRILALGLEDDGTNAARRLAESRAVDVFEKHLSPKGPDQLPLKHYAHNFWDWQTSNFLAYSRAVDEKARSREDCYNKHRIILKHVLPHLGEIPVKEIDRQVLKDWILRLRKTLSSSTVSHCLKAIRPIFEELVQERILTFNYALGLKVTPRNKPRGDLSIAEAKRLLNPDTREQVWGGSTRKGHRPELHFALNMLCATLGARWNNVVVLRRQDLVPFFHLGRKIWAVRMYFGYGAQTGIKPGTKTGKGRTVILSDDIFQLLDPLMGKEGFLFPGKNPERPLTHHSCSAAFNQAVRNIGISEEERQRRDLGIHSWRRYFVSRAVASHIPEEIRRSFTEHATDEMENYYTQLAPTELSSVLRFQGEIPKAQAPDTLPQEQRIS